jgi:hypothetical protein
VVLGFIAKGFNIAQIIRMRHKIVVATAIGVFKSVDRLIMEKNLKNWKKIFTFLPFGAY